LATWNGSVSRLNAKYGPIWRSQLQAQNVGKPGASTPTARLTGWTNNDAQPAPLTPNLLAQTKAIISVIMSDRAVELKNRVEMLTDGAPESPAKAWVSSSDINMIDSGWRGSLSIVFDTFRTQLRVNKITFVEDEKHPESWLRDANLEYWDAAKEKWVFAASLLSDSAVHTHTLPKPIDASRFRLVKSETPGVWPVGNIRLAEVVFHGEALGGSHPDVVAKNAVANLFQDDNVTFRKSYIHGHNSGLNIENSPEAFAGGAYLRLDPGTRPGAGAAPYFVPPWGHAMPGWNFEIAENPQPGQYRYLQFAWRAFSDKATGIGIGVDSVGFHAGTVPPSQTRVVKISDAPPTSWKIETIDLWEQFGKKTGTVSDMRFYAVGGPVGFDQILLGRTKADLPPQK